MRKIEDTTINLIRGDSFSATLEIKQDDKAYVLGENDVVKFTLRKSALKFDKSDYADEPIIEKVLTNATLDLELLPSDTAELPYDSYKYYIKLTTGDGEVETLVSGKFNIITE